MSSTADRISSTPIKSEKNDLIHILKFRPDPRPSWPFQSVDYLKVLDDRIRMYIQPRQDSERGSTKKKNVPVEIFFDNIEQVETHFREVSTASVFLFKSVKSNKGDELSDIIHIYFAKNDKVGTGRQLDKFLDALEDRDVKIFDYSSGSSQPIERGTTGNNNNGEESDDIEEDKVDAEDDHDSQVEEGLKVRSVKVQSPDATLRSKSQSPEGHHSLEDEIDVPSSQPTKRRHEYRDGETDDESEDESKGKERCKPLKKKRKRDSGVDIIAYDDLAVTMENIKKRLIDNRNIACEEAKKQRERLRVNLWHKVRCGINQAQGKNIDVQDYLKDSVKSIQIHGQEFRQHLLRGKTNFTQLIAEMVTCHDSLQAQQISLSKLSSPF